MALDVFVFQGSELVPLGVDDRPYVSHILVPNSTVRGDTRNHGL